jgi:hypothetical protein
MAGFSIRSSGKWLRARCSRRGRPGPGSNLRTRWLAILGVASLLVPAARPVQAQSVLGQLFDAGTGAPVEGALVLLLDQEGEEAGGYLTNDVGRFIIRAPGPGSYTLKAERIGYLTVNSDPFQLEISQQFGIRLETEQTAIHLEGIRVEGDQKCVVRPGEGLELANVWEEARKALTVQNWTEREGLYRFQISRYERNLDLLGRQVDDEVREVQTWVSGSPLESAPVDDLLSNGFVRREPDGGFEYFAADASVLLSDRFLDTHCFRLEADDDRPGQMGLGFEPVRAGGIPDIAGTLWLDAGTANLETLEYGYTWAPWRAAKGIARGHLEFEALPNGAWVIRRWWIRMPRVKLDMSRSNDSWNEGVSLTGLREVGGEIASFTALMAPVVSENPRGVLEGQVWDSTRNIPLADATVFLSGTQFAAETDPGGTFLLPDLPPGVFNATFTHPRMDSLGVFFQGIEVEITPGEPTRVELAIPADAGVLVSSCSESQLAARDGVVIGFVREAGTENPLEGASVAVTWSTFEDRGGGSTFVEHHHGIQAASDGTGRYSVCGVPPGTTLTVQASLQGRRSIPVQLMASEEGYTVVHIEMGGR